MAQTNDAPARATGAASLEDREFAILRELSREGEARVGFQALKRQLEVHQQVLSRTLRRLEDAGLVLHEADGYRLTDRGFHALSGRPAPVKRDTLTIAKALLPPGVGAREVTAHLSRRWFQGLRWYGQVGGPGETTLIWRTEPGERAVRVRVCGGSFTLEVEGDAGHVPYGAARALLAALAEMYGIGGNGEGGPLVGLVVETGQAA